MKTKTYFSGRSRRTMIVETVYKSIRKVMVVFPDGSSDVQIFRTAAINK